MKKIDIPLQIEKYMALRRITQTKLAELIGISQAALSAMLSGKANLPVRRLNDIISVLNIPQKEADNMLLNYAKGIQISGMNISGGNTTNEGITAIGYAENFFDSLFDEKAIRTDERQKIIDLIMNSEKILPEMKITIYQILKQQE